MRIYRVVIISGIMTVLALFTGCGPYTPAGTSSLSTPATTPASTGTPHSPPATKVPPRTARTGPVTLDAGPSLYRTSDTISVTLSNHSNQTIYFPDHLTNCTVLLLQRQQLQPLEGGNWQSINPCRLAIATRMYSLVSGQSLIVRFSAPVHGWQPGLYRATLGYQSSLNTRATTTIFSLAFRVGPFIPPAL